MVLEIRIMIAMLVDKGGYEWGFWDAGNILFCDLVELTWSAYVVITHLAIHFLFFLAFQLKKFTRSAWKWLDA